MNLKKYDKVIVSWVDTVYQPGWHSIDDIHSEPDMCSTIGFFLSDDDECIKICSTITHDKVADITQINKSSVIKVSKCKN